MQNYPEVDVHSYKNLRNGKKCMEFWTTKPSFLYIQVRNKQVISFEGQNLIYF